jgi:hypothetical protein
MPIVRHILVLKSSDHHNMAEVHRVRPQQAPASDGTISFNGYVLRW